MGKNILIKFLYIPVQGNGKFGRLNFKTHSRNCDTHGYSDKTKIPKTEYTLCLKLDFLDFVNKNIRYC